MLYDGMIIEVNSPDEIKNTTNPIVKQFISGAAKGPITDNQNFDKEILTEGELI
jgi:phospholipid/cholesterol/gamma-HCH transport system ATP-binding protein